MMLWIYDLETLQDCFTGTFKNYETKEVRTFVIHKSRDDLKSLVSFINNPNLWLAGYNNYHFDNQILKYIWENEIFYKEESISNITNHIYKFTLSIIEDSWNGHTYNLPFKSLDLMKIGNLDQKSLKLTGTLLKWHKLQDMPVDGDLETLLKYNLNDVEITEKLFLLLEPQIRLRFSVSKEYDVNVFSDTDSGIANKLLEKFYADATGIHPKVFKEWRTKRPRIGFWDVIFHDIHFRTKELRSFLDNLRKTIYYPSIPFTKRSVVFDGVKYIIGVGGLHSEDKGGLFTSNDHMNIIDADVGSYYPSMIVNNSIYPAHLGMSFIKKYKEIIEQRIAAKDKSKDKTLSKEQIDKYKLLADTLKIVINSSFGKMGYEHHWLYDPLAMLKVTINGQLYLLMLIEHLTLNGFNVISANTDGIITEVHKDKEDEYKKTCKHFEDATKFNLDYTYYKTYARTSVNDYIAITKDGHIKTKGAFNVPDLSNLHEDTFMLRRGFDRPIIAIALNEFFKNNTPIKKTILEHKDIYDFCTSKKTDKKFSNEFHYIKDSNARIDFLSRSVRYYVSTDGGALYKKENGTSKMINYCVGKRVTIFNNYFESNNYNIDYNYYISETQNLIDEIIKLQLTLF